MCTVVIYRMCAVCFSGVEQPIPLVDLVAETAVIP